MAQKPRYKDNRAGLRDLLSTEGTKSMIEDRTKAIVDRCNAESSWGGYKSEVEDDKVGPLLVEGLEGGPAVGCGGGLVSAGAEVDCQCAQESAVVVDCQHEGHRSNLHVRAAAGSVRVMVSPPPGVSVAARVAFMVSARPRAADKPSPSPGAGWHVAEALERGEEPLTLC